MKVGKFLAKLGPFKWTLHNLVAHPISELIYLVGMGSALSERASNWVHDITVPEHELGAGRGKNEGR